MSSIVGSVDIVLVCFLSSVALILMVVSMVMKEGIFMWIALMFWVFFGAETYQIHTTATSEFLPYAMYTLSICMMFVTLFLRARLLHDSAEKREKEESENRKSTEITRISANIRMIQQAKMNRRDRNAFK